MTLQLLSVPAGHPYVHHVLPRGAAADAIVSRPDVHRFGAAVAGAAAQTGVWWPPRALEAQWLAARARELDVLHVHFGYETRTPHQLHAMADTLQAAGVPLVLTVHDLCNPHLADTGTHREQLAVLMARAAAVLTLTAGAAAELAVAFGRTAHVTAHPHVVPLKRIAEPTPRPGRGDRVIGVPLGALRANIDPVVVDALVEVVRARPGTALQVDLRPSGADTEVGAHLRRLAERGLLRLSVLPRLDDGVLWDRLQGWSAVVLPYRFGTHSGWLEACWDLGVPVIAPRSGHYREQHPVAAYDLDTGNLDTGGLDIGGLDTGSLETAVDQALAGPVWTARDGARRAGGRARQRDEIAARHLQLYAALLAADSGAGA